ncbi:MAG: thioredoxin domain-containing protein [archaeon]
MICIIALIVFGVLGIFSVSYRKIAVEAMDCVFKRVTFRKCTTGLDKRLKSQITGKLMKKSPRVARFIYKHFEVISWIFTVLLFVSLAYSAFSIYNFALYGNCYGPESTAFCVLDVTNQFNIHEGVSTCGEGHIPGDAELIRPEVRFTDPAFGPLDAKIVLVEFGCFKCSYTADAEPVVKQVLEEYPDVLFVYKDFPLSTHMGSEKASNAAQCVYNMESDKYWDFRALLLENQDSQTDENILFWAAKLGLDEQEFKYCYENNLYENVILQNIEDGHTAGIYGTPTFFINDRAIVGPKPFRAFKNIIEQEMKENGE